MNENILPPLIGVAVAVITVIGTIVAQRMSGRITSQNSTIEQFQEAATRSDRLATEARTEADKLRGDITELWKTVRTMQVEMSEQQQQLDWSKGYIRKLTDHINQELGPPPPPLPAGLHWPGFGESAASAQ